MIAKGGIYPTSSATCAGYAARAKIIIKVCSEGNVQGGISNGMYRNELGWPGIIRMNGIVVGHA